MTVLANEPLGSFMVRQSETQAGVLALSVRVPKTFHPLGITHYIISRLDTGGYQIKVSRPPARAAALLTTLFISFSGLARVQCQVCLQHVWRHQLLKVSAPDTGISPKPA